MSDNPKENGEIGNTRDEKGRFVEGNPGGPGRKQGFSIVALIERELKKRYGEEPGKTKAEKFVEDYIDKSIDTVDGMAFRDLEDRFDGKPTNKTEVTGANGEPITLKVEFVEKDLTNT